MKKEELISKQYEVLTETSPDCIKLFDLEGNLLYINPGGLKEHNLESVAEAVEKKWKAEDTIIEEDKTSFSKAFQKALKGDTTTIEIRHNNLVEKRDVCLETISPVKNDSGEVIGIFGVSRDITQIKKFENEQGNQKNQLEIEVEKKTRELRTKIEELEKVNKFMIDREIKMVELKKEIDKLENKL